MKSLEYEEFLDNDTFYLRSEIKEERDTIYKNTLYLKNHYFFKDFFCDDTPTSNLFIKFLTQKGLYLFLISILEDKNIHYIEFNYNDKIEKINIKEFFSFYYSYAADVTNSLILSKIATILSYNNFDFSIDENLSYITDDNKYNYLLYKMNDQERITLINHILSFLNRKKVLERYLLDEVYEKRIEYLQEKYLNALDKKAENRKNQYIIDDSIISALDRYKKDTYSKLEEAIFYFIALSNIVDISSSEHKNINELTLENNIVNYQSLGEILTTILDDLNLEYKVIENSIQIEIAIENKVKFVIDDNYSFENLSEHIVNVENQQGTDELIYKILEEYKESVEKDVAFNNSLTQFRKKFNKDTINKYDKLKTFIELITRGEKINDQKYQKIIFNIFYGDNHDYEISFYKSMLQSGNYHFFTIVSRKDQYILIDSDDLNKIRLISNLELAEIQKKSINLSNKIVVEEVETKHVQ